MGRGSKKTGQPSFALLGLVLLIQAMLLKLVAHIIYFVATGVLGAWGFSQQGQSLSFVYQRLLNRSDGSIDS